MLAWDSFKCHITDSVKQELAQAKIDPVILPCGCTKYIQPPDVAWNKPFKAKVTEKYNAWMAGRAPDRSEDDQTHCLKERQPCRVGQDCLASIQQALKGTCATDPFADVMLLDVEETAPESSLIELSDNDIEVD